MGQRARMERTLRLARAAADAYRGTWQEARYLRRAHLLDLVLSGRYTTLQRRAELVPHMKRSHGFTDEDIALDPDLKDLEGDHNFDHASVKKAGYAHPVHPVWRLDL